jgi:ABC-type sugar transport system ATPase subunit
MAYAQFDRLRVDSVVEGFDLRLADGEAISILGPASFDKPRLLRAIVGFESLSDGAISIEGAPIDVLPVGSRGIALIQDGLALYPHLTTEENIAFPMRCEAMAADQRRDRLAELTSQLELEPLRARYPGELSAAERLRVALARAMARRPRLLLLDDPLRLLPVNDRVDLRYRLRDLQRSWRVTTLYATSDFEDAMALSDRIAFISGGRVHQIETPALMYVNPATAAVAAALGNPGINVLEAHYETGAVRVADQSVPLPEGSTAHLCEGDAVLVAVRPEAFDPNGDRRNSLVAVLDPSSRLSLGSHSTVRGQVADKAVIVQVPGNPSDIPRRAYAPASSLLLFDRASGDRLR